MKKIFPRFVVHFCMALFSCAVPAPSFAVVCVHGPRLDWTGQMQSTRCFCKRQQPQFEARTSRETKNQIWLGDLDAQPRVWPQEKKSGETREPVSRAEDQNASRRDFTTNIQCLKIQDVGKNEDTDARTDQEIESLFQDLFSGELGYTLIGAKPITSTEMLFRHPYCCRTIEKCLSILKKTFSGSKNFALKITRQGPYYSIALINKKALRKLVETNPIVKSFIEINFRSMRDFYSEIESNQESLYRILDKNDQILGYLLGYSKSNIDYYIRRIDVGRYLKKYPLVRFHPLPGGKYSHCPVVRRNITPYQVRLEPSSGFSSLEEEWQWIKDVAWDLDNETFPTPPYFVSLPCYICRHGGDSELARERYKKASGKVAELFYGKSFQKAIMKAALQ